MAYLFLIQVLRSQACRSRSELKFLCQIIQFSSFGIVCFSCLHIRTWNKCLNGVFQSIGSCTGISFLKMVCLTRTMQIRWWDRMVSMMFYRKTWQFSFVRKCFQFMAASLSSACFLMLKQCVSRRRKGIGRCWCSWASALNKDLVKWGGDRLPVSPSCSVHSVRAGSLMLGNCFVCTSAIRRAV